MNEGGRKCECYAGVKVCQSDVNKNKEGSDINLLSFSATQIDQYWPRLSKAVFSPLVIVRANRLDGTIVY